MNEDYDYWRIQAADVLTQLHECERENAELRAVLAHFRRALDQIDRHIVGACDSPTSDMPDPCEECGEMREIAHQALRARYTKED